MLSGTHFLSSEQAGVRSRNSPCAVCQESCPEEGLCNHANSLSLEEREERHLGTSSRLQVTQDTCGTSTLTLTVHERTPNETNGSHFLQKDKRDASLFGEKPEPFFLFAAHAQLVLAARESLHSSEAKENGTARFGNDGCLTPSLASLRGSGTASIRVLE